MVGRGTYYYKYQETKSKQQVARSPALGDRRWVRGAEYCTIAYCYLGAADIRQMRRQRTADLDDTVKFLIGNLSPTRLPAPGDQDKLTHLPGGGVGTEVERGN